MHFGKGPNAEGTSRWRSLLTQLLHTHDTPRRTAAAFAVGVFFGFSPFLGFHTILGLVFAFVLNYNRVAVLLGVYSNLPWILPAYYTLATIGGAALLGADVPPDLIAQLREVLSNPGFGELRSLARGLAPLFWSFALGSTIGSVLLAILAYQVSLRMIVARRHHREHLP